MPTIKSKNFTLRPYKKSDEKSLVLNIKNKIIDRNTSNIPHPYTLKEARKWIIRCQKQAKMKKPEQVTFTIDINGEASGGISLSKIDYRHNQAELGYWLGEKYWGKGIMTNACKLVT
ncbi:GNAT family N-acetyltransferase, partial [Candidatus Falkowbacteria bacterium]|nr:GNAT family N-acetyltransferase [Candidatus Falkowbacteria bacterium]